MRESSYLCLSCNRASLFKEQDRLFCPFCHKTYEIMGGVPIILPEPRELELVSKQGEHGISLQQLQKIYDRVYGKDGLMGTDLDKRYDRTTKRTLLSFAEIVANQRILDVGTGIGNLWDYVKNPVNGYALDLSLAGMRKTLARNPYLTVSVSIAEFIPYPDQFFDSVIAADTIEHTISPEEALKEIYRVLKPGGVFAASFPIPKSLRKWGWNRLFRQRPDFRFLIRLSWVVIKRTLLFGRPDFQPIDRDCSIDEWKHKLVETGFIVENVLSWPNPPEIPIVYLVKACRRQR